MKDFAGRTAFVTGGANGVGIGLVRALLAEGCKVAIADVRQDAIDRALKSLDNREVMGVQLDVSSRADFAAAADAVEARFGPVSVVCNNAGVNLFQTIEESSYDDWDWLLGVNLHGVINGVQTFVPRMVERVKAGAQSGGHVLNTASMAAFLSSGSPGIYNTTKAALVHLTKVLGSELGPAVRVNAVAPGLVKTDMARGLWEGKEEAIGRRMPTGRLGEPADIANAILFLLSDAASWITGHTLVVDGGALVAGR